MLVDVSPRRSRHTLRALRHGSMLGGGGADGRVTAKASIPRPVLATARASARGSILNSESTVTLRSRPGRPDTIPLLDRGVRLLRRVHPQAAWPRAPAPPVEPGTASRAAPGRRGCGGGRVLYDAEHPRAGPSLASQSMTSTSIGPRATASRASVLQLNRRQHLGEDGGAVDEFASSEEPVRFPLVEAGTIRRSTSARMDSRGSPRAGGRPSTRPDFAGANARQDGNAPPLEVARSFHEAPALGAELLQVHVSVFGRGRHDGEATRRR